MSDNNEAVTKEQLKVWFEQVFKKHESSYSKVTGRYSATYEEAAQQCGIPATWQPVVVGFCLGNYLDDWRATFNATLR